ncbi:unnamed protein product [Dibothriocephalus latus]|uniref:Uncharacterized protein n=1 Tax=Dibothriocephalus latus TaxID=60516 RepID=A0A3P6SVT1_DIBLA|nr:unnamed protein product [Dibothriocephalus latus]
MQTNLHTTSVDLTKTFDTMNRDGLLKFTQKFGCLECFTHVVLQEDIINVIDSLRAELIAARKKSEALELEKKQRSRENENEILELESSLNSLIQATRTKDRAYSAVPYATAETAHHYGDNCARQSNRVTEDIREAFLEKPTSGNVKPTYVMENPEATEEQPLEIVFQHSDLPEKFRYRNNQKQDYLAELGEHLAEADKKAADRTSAIVQKLQALEQALQKSEKNEAQTQRERDPMHKARPDQSPRVEALQADRSRKQYEDLYGAAVEALELGKHILKDVDEMAFNSLFTTGHRGVHALPSIIFCLYSAIRTLRSELASKTAKYQQSAEVIKNIKEEILSDKSKMASDFDKRFKEEKSRMHSELAAAIQRAELATQEARTISERANKARESLQQELVEKNRTISELKRASADENTKLNANIITLEAKIHALETSLEESRRETTRVKTERDEATKHYSSLTAKLEAREERIHTLENDLLDKNDRWRNTERKLQEATDALNRLYEVTTQATKTTTDINSLLEKFGHRTKKEPGVEEAASPKKPPSPLEVVKKLCTEQTTGNNKLKRPGHRKHAQDSGYRARYEWVLRSSRLVTEHRHLIAQKNSLTSEMEKQAKLMKDSQSTINKLRSHIGAIERERAGITNTLELKQTQLQRISKERDYFLQLLNKKTEEVAALKATQAKTPEPVSPPPINT